MLSFVVASTTLWGNDLKKLQSLNECHYERDKKVADRRGSGRIRR